MKLIIKCDGVKREINGSFSICGGRQDLETLSYYIQAGSREGFGYGWIDIHPEIIKDIPNEAPYNWHEEAK